ncbi:urea active transporter [Lasiodiplodia theobromae]|uniref:Urea active transporter n=1 Tax=Lasiodiplodia theobromae TaxID=45133 RepID=A0A8H7IS45_9PEZI|nr:urea active transporter [Lasiodiplodia theobromae]
MAVEILARDGSSGEALAPPLSQAVGYVVVVAVGLVIAFGMVFVTKILKKTVGEDNEKTEVFMTANRSVTRGLTSSAVISSWLWSTAMLGSSLVGYQYGVSGPFWFAAGCSPMIVFFALLGISCKRKIPEAHTLLEIVRIRYGNIAHIVYMVLCLLNNLFACANMLLGASAVITAMTGMHVIAATFLLPVGVALYTFVGGIKATFLTDYLHTFTILIILCFFTVKAFTVEEIGSLSNLFEIFQQAGFRHPVSGNHDGSYLTMTSKGGILFGIIHICANFGLVIMDTSFFIKAFAASPSAVVPGYVIGGIAYFAIPWAVGTLASSLVLGLESSAIFPTYPRRMTAVEVSNGLVLPYAFILVAGKGGAACILLITFMAVTSTLSAQVIAVSSILAFDVYRTYVNRGAGDADVIRWSHYGVVGFAVFAAAFSTMLHYVGIDLGWTLYMLGVITCPGIFPTALTILWRQQSRAAAILAPTLGMATGIAVWLGTAHAFYGEVSIASTGATLPCMYGTVAATVAPLPYSLAITALTGGQGWEWSEFRREKLAFEVEVSGRDAGLERAVEEGEGGEDAEEARKRLKRWGRIAAGWAAATFLGHWVLWPLPMYAARYVFGEKFFAAWLVVAIIWLWGTLLVAGFYPLVDGRDQILAVWRGLRSGSEKSHQGNADNSTSASDSEGNGLDRSKTTTPGESKNESSFDVIAKAETIGK